MSEMKRLGVLEVKAALDGGWKPYWIDCRKQPEWDRAKLPQVDLFLPHEQIIAQGIGDLPKDQPILVQCRSGGRSGMAGAALLAMGYTDVTNLEGGLLDWKAKIDPSLDVT
jgi:rhodanese-related sulfurtransferase